MKRSDLLNSGEYISIPRSLLADAELSAGDKLVYAVMVEHLGPMNEASWPGPSRIANETGLSLGGVKKCLRHLKSVGLLSPQGTAEGRYKTRIYAVSGNKVTGSQKDQVTKEPMTGLQNSPMSGSQKGHKVPYINTEVSTEDGASPSPADSSQSVILTAGKKKRESLTDAEKISICESPEAMFTYLAEGNRWYAEGASMKEVAPAATVPQLAAFWWAVISKARHVAGIPLSVPDFPRILGAVKQLRKTMTQDELVKLMQAIGKHWGTICGSLAWMSSPPALDETTLSNRHIREAAARLIRGETLKTAAQSHTIPRVGSQPTATLTPSQQGLADTINERLKHQQLL